MDFNHISFQTKNGWFIPGEGCGIQTKIKYMNTVPKSFKGYECTFIAENQSNPKQSVTGLKHLNRRSLPDIFFS